jgi:NAD(P)-dependent dehydrogenase (short-subunit alcohol dehydrogenase family)
MQERIGEPEDIALVLNWLVSDAADYVTTRRIRRQQHDAVPGFATGALPGQA